MTKPYAIEIWTVIVMALLLIGYVIPGWNACFLVALVLSASSSVSFAVRGKHAR